jgi:soluble calcium-activated nucleotidase 1
MNISTSSSTSHHIRQKSRERTSSLGNLVSLDIESDSINDNTSIAVQVTDSKYMKKTSSANSLSSLKNVINNVLTTVTSNNNNNNSDPQDLELGYDKSPITSSSNSSSSQMKKILFIVLGLMALLFLYHVNRVNTVITTTLDEPLQDRYALDVQDSTRTDYPIIMCADRDSFSFNSEQHAWTSLLIEGVLKRDPQTGLYSVHFDKDAEGNVIGTALEGKLAEGKRGLELSELKRFNGHLYTFDDRTGIVYEILDRDPTTKKRKVVARYILNDGDGHTDKGFKSEWATVKDGKLHVGSIGKEWTTPGGEVISINPMWVKTIDLSGRIKSISWEKQYNLLRNAADVAFPGYMIHESGEWSEFYKRWFFLPRRVSKLPYDEVKDVNRGSNIMLAASEDFKNISIKRIGDLTPTRGFSTFKFVPGRPREIVAIKSEEVGEKMNSYITVFTTNGKVLLPETLIANEKIEGVEIE